MVYIFDFNYVIQQWQAIGIFDVLLPFILLFAIIFAILQKTKVLGGRNGIDAVVAMAIGFFVIINPFVNEILKVILANTAIAIIVIVALMLILGLVWGGQKMKAWNFIGGIIGLAIFVWILGRVADYYEMYYPGTVVFSQMWWAENLPWIIPLLIILIFAIIVISSGGEKKTGTPFAEIWKHLTEKEAWD
jgi:hypothetical protein